MAGRQAAAVVGGMITVVVAGCGGAGSARQGVTPPAVSHPAPVLSTPVVTPSATPSPTPTRAPLRSDVVVVSDTNPANGAVPVVLVRFDGTVLGSASLPTAQQWSVSAGPGGAYWVAGGHLHLLDTQGHSTDLGAVAPDQRGNVAVSPDGASWLYATATATPDGVFTNRLWRGGVGRGSQLLAERVSDPMHPTPGMPTSWVYSLKSWTAAGVVVVREPSGGCGCWAFDMETVSGNSLLVDPDTGAGTPLPTDRSCPLSGTAADATAVCFHSAKSGAADELRLLNRDGSTQRFTLSGSTAGGDARFDPSRTTLAYATVPSNLGCDGWTAQTTLRVLDLASGDAHAVGPAGLQPEAWLSGGRIAGTMTTRDFRTSVVSIDARTGAVQTLMDGRTLYVVGAVA